MGSMVSYPNRLQILNFIYSAQNLARWKLTEALNDRIRWTQMLCEAGSVREPRPSGWEGKKAYDSIRCYVMCVSPKTSENPSLTSGAPSGKGWRRGAPSWRAPIGHTLFFCFLQPSSGE